MKMATKLFVGSLPFETTSDELREIFAKAGKVADANVVMDKMTGRSRGFGFVEMASETDAKSAIDTLNGTDVGGRKIFVSEARPQRGDSGGVSGGQSAPAADTAGDSEEAASNKDTKSEEAASNKDAKSEEDSA